MSKSPGAAFVDPVISSTDKMHCDSSAFLIKTPTSTHRYATLLFDLGVRKDQKNGPTTFIEGAKQVSCIIEEKDVATILRENGQDSANVEGIV